MRPLQLHTTTDMRVCAPHFRAKVQHFNYGRPHTAGSVYNSSGYYIEEHQELRGGLVGYSRCQNDRDQQGCERGPGREQGEVITAFAYQEADRTYTAIIGRQIG